MTSILIAPDKFKGSLTAFEVCNAIEEGLRQASPLFHTIKCPMADGGDGLADVITYYTSAVKQMAHVQDPLGRTIKAEWLLSADGKTAFIEMAKASGLNLLKPDEYNPLKTSTYGTGQLIKAAIERGVEKIVLGIGGSATNDCGIGMAAALGYRFFNSSEIEIKPVGGNMGEIARIDNSSAISYRQIKFQVACDVKNKLLGKEGAAQVYAPQKGADAAMVKKLEDGMAKFAATAEKQVGIALTEIEGGGAAGGMGAGCIAFLNAELINGIHLVMQYARLEEHLQLADYVITGEGKIDEQTLHGKAVMGVASLAKKQNKTVVAFCGSQAIPATAMAACGIDAVFSIMKYPMTWEEAKNNACLFLKDTAFSVGNLLLKKNSGNLNEDSSEGAKS